jgi:hypothetical protein
MIRQALRYTALAFVTLFVGDTLWNVAEAVIRLAAR